MNMAMISADIESKLRQIEKDPEGAGTVQLLAATQNITVLANQAFQPLFERQVRCLSKLWLWSTYDLLYMISYLTCPNQGTS